MGKKPNELGDIQFAVGARAIVAAMTTEGGWQLHVSSVVAQLRAEASGPFHDWISELNDRDAFDLISKARAHLNKLVLNYHAPTHRRIGPGAERNPRTNAEMLSLPFPFLTIRRDWIPIAESSVWTIVWKLLAHHLTNVRAPVQAEIVNVIKDLGDRHGRSHDRWIIEPETILTKVNERRDKRQAKLTMSELRGKLEAIQANLRDMLWQPFVVLEGDDTFRIHIVSSLLREQVKTFLNSLIPVPDNVDP